MTPPALLFFLRIPLAIHGLLWFQKFLEVCFFSLSFPPYFYIKKYHWNLDMDCKKSIDDIC